VNWIELADSSIASFVLVMQVLSCNELFDVGNSHSCSITSFVMLVMQIPVHYQP
jgi:hypothetical protein